MTIFTIFKWKIIYVNLSLDILKQKCKYIYIDDFGMACFLVKGWKGQGLEYQLLPNHIIHSAKHGCLGNNVN